MPLPEAVVVDPTISLSREPNVLMVLTSANGRRCAKHYTRVESGDIGCVPYDRESHWLVAPVAFADMTSFVNILRALTESRSAILVRGALRDGTATNGPILRRCVGMGATFQPAMRSWVALDVDGLDVPEASIPALMLALPERFRTAACFYHFTSSMGVLTPLTNFRIRLWFRLSHPMSDAAWKRELRPYAQAARLDLSLFNPVQPHYIATPTFEGMDDPIAHLRSGVYDPAGATTEVDVSDIQNRDELDSATTVISAITRTGIDAHPDQIAAVLAQFDTRTRHSSRHATAVALIGELYGHGLSGEEAMRHAQRYMVQQGRPPERGELERALQFVVRRADAGELRTNETPISLVFEEHDQSSPIPEAPTTPEEAAANSAANDEATDEWPAQPNSLARRVYADLFGGEGFVRWGKQDFEWTGAYWRPLADDEELAARIQRSSRLAPSIAERGATALRNDHHRSFLHPPCLLSDGTPIAPRIPVRNGWLSVEEIRIAATPPVLRPYTSEVFDILPPMPVVYNPTTPCPHFTRFLDECFAGDDESRYSLIRLMGYLLFKGNEYQRVFICSGAPASGKSTWLKVMRALLGPQRGVVGDLRSFGSDFGLASVFEAQALFLPEASHGTEGARLNGESIDQLKRISGGDSVLVRRKYLPDVTAEVMPTPVVVCNQPPVVRDEAFVRRLVAIHFPHTFVGREDPTLPGRLLGELEGIFNVCLQGLTRIAHERDPFPPPAAPIDEDGGATPARELYEQIRADSSPVAEFARHCLRSGPSTEFLSQETIHAAYRRWCARNSYRAMDERTFTGHLRHIQITGTRWSRRRTESGRVRGIEAAVWTAEGRELQSDTGVF